MGNLIKINMYVEAKMKRKSRLKLGTIEEAILKYNNWLQKTHREDEIESYKEFLHVQ